MLRVALAQVAAIVEPRPTRKCLWRRADYVDPHRNPLARQHFRDAKHHVASLAQPLATDEQQAALVAR